MTLIANKKRLIIISVLVMLIVVISAVGFQYFQSTPKVSALPCHEVEHYYYSDATYGTQVGYRFVTCHGVYTEGQVTQYVVSFDGDDCPENCPMN
jgi:hypothetical protein